MAKTEKKTKKQSTATTAQPTATVMINGLSVFSENDWDDSIEFVFLKAITENHPFRMRIFRGTRIVWSSDNYAPHYFRDSSITISKTKLMRKSRREHEDGRDYDDKDFRWLLNLKKDFYYNQDVRYKPNSPEHIYAKLAIKYANFHTKVKSINPARILRLDNGNEKSGQRKMGRVLGADLFCENAGDKIEVNISWRVNIVPIVLSYPKNGGPYYISIDFNCIPSVDDFPCIYEIVEPPDGIRYTLRYARPEPIWSFRGIIANTKSGQYILENSLNERNEKDFPEDLREYFDSAAEAEAKNYKSVDDSGIMAGEFACQSGGTGGS